MYEQLGIYTLYFADFANSSITLLKKNAESAINLLDIITTKIVSAVSAVSVVSSRVIMPTVIEKSVLPYNWWHDPLIESNMVALTNSKKSTNTTTEVNANNVGHNVGNNNQISPVTYSHQCHFKIQNQFETYELAIKINNNLPIKNTKASESFYVRFEFQQKYDIVSDCLAVNAYITNSGETHVDILSNEPFESQIYMCSNCYDSPINNCVGISQNSIEVIENNTEKGNNSEIKLNQLVKQYQSVKQYQLVNFYIDCSFIKERTVLISSVIRIKCNSTFNYSTLHCSTGGFGRIVIVTEDKVYIYNSSLARVGHQ